MRNGRGYDYDQRDYYPPRRDWRGDSFEGRWRGYDREMGRPASGNGWREGRFPGDSGRYGGDRDDGRYGAQGPRDRFGGRPRGYGQDYWWIGEHELRRRGRMESYDDAYRRFSDEHHPRFSPVGGMYPPMGGRYSTERPRPLRDSTWFSDWTRWF